jgi:hypothetical protein
MKMFNFFLTVAIITTASITNPIKAQIPEFFGLNSHTAYSANSLSPNYFNNTNTLLSWDSIRMLSEINKIDTSDAYPYISPDGLRIYFAQENAGTNLYFASRPDMYSFFGIPELVSTDFPSGSFSCWLTNDELEIFFIKADPQFEEYTLKYSIRNSIINRYASTNK